MGSEKKGVLWRLQEDLIETGGSKNSHSSYPVVSYSLCGSSYVISSHQQSLVKLSTWSYIREKACVHAWAVVLKGGRGMVVDTLPMSMSKDRKLQVTLYTHNV